MDDKDNTTKEREQISTPIMKAMEQRFKVDDVPLMSQEEIDMGRPLINWTAVICTAIVSVAVVIIFCVAKPWRSIDGYEKGNGVTQETDCVDDSALVAADSDHDTDAKQEEPVDTDKAETTKSDNEKNANNKPVAIVHEEPKVVKTALPVVPITTTGMPNIYNNIRLIDASTRKLTASEVAEMTPNELSLARN